MTKDFALCPKIPARTKCRDQCENLDYNCNGLYKCCPHACGTKCVGPIFKKENLDAFPAVPEILKASSYKDRLIKLKWRMDNLTSEEARFKIYVITEMRAQRGAKFQPKLMGKWHTKDHNYTITMDNRTIESFYHVKCCRWYQFRMYSVNANGSGGYSNVMTVYKPPHPPQPPINVTEGKFSYKTYIFKSCDLK